jgi:hypothetical protein
MAVWQLPRSAPKDQERITVTLSKAATSAANLRGQIRGAKPAPKTGPSQDVVNIAPAPLSAQMVGGRCAAPEPVPDHGGGSNCSIGLAGGCRRGSVGGPRPRLRAPGQVRVRVHRTDIEGG